MKRYLSFTFRLNGVIASQEIKDYAKKYCDFASGYYLGFGSDENDVVLVQGKVYGNTKLDCKKDLSALKNNLKLNFKRFGLKSISTILQMDGYTISSSLF